MYNIQKTLFGYVLVLTSGYVVYKLDPLAWVRINGTNDGVLISDTSGKQIELFLSDIVTTEVIPALPVAAPVTAAELLDLLNASFFENIATVGGGGSETNEAQTEVNSGTYLVLTSDENIVCTGDCTIVLPAIVAGVWRQFKIWVRPSVTVSVKGTGTDTVNDETELVLLGGEEIVVRNLLNLTNWSIGL